LCDIEFCSKTLLQPAVVSFFFSFFSANRPSLLILVALPNLNSLQPYPIFSVGPASRGLARTSAMANKYCFLIELYQESCSFSTVEELPVTLDRIIC
jgi:hypothetical protein